MLYSYTELNLLYYTLLLLCQAFVMSRDVVERQQLQEERRRVREQKESEAASQKAEIRRSRSDVTQVVVRV